MSFCRIEESVHFLKILFFVREDLLLVLSLVFVYSATPLQLGHLVVFVFKPYLSFPHFLPARPRPSWSQ